MTQEARIYTVEPRDTLWGISKRLNIDIDRLARENGLKGQDRHSLEVGQWLILPHAAEHESELFIRVTDLIFFPLARIKLKITFDDSEKDFTTDVDGQVGPLLIHDHANGIKVRFQNIEGQYELIADHKAVPLGKARLVIHTRQILLKSSYWQLHGKQQITTSQIRGQVKQQNQDVHVLPSDVKRRAPSAKAPSRKLPQPMLKEGRAEGGAPVHVVATVFAEENLYLQPANEKYRKFIIASAKKYGFTPPALAALINAEAAKGKGGEWKADCVNGTSSAAGLTQFLATTWLGLCADPRSMMNARLKHEKHYDKVTGKLDGEEYAIYGHKGEKVYRLPAGPVLRGRFDAEYSIDAAALYGKINLEYLQKRGLNVNALAPEDLAKVMYLAHHEGAQGAAAILQGTLQEEIAEKRLTRQIGHKAKELINRANGRNVQAYVHWLFSYIDSHINVSNFMVNPQGKKPHSSDQIAEALGSRAAAPLMPRMLAETSPRPSHAGTAEAWHNPLASCILRSAKLASSKGAMFGMVRNGGTKAHQGIDLVAIPGTPIYAVANGRIVYVRPGYNEASGYGATLLLAVDINDLPSSQRRYCRSSCPGTPTVYFFYAHLSRILVARNDFVQAGQVLGSTGASGNARGMISVHTGAHLHFEARQIQNVSTGLVGRFDPLPLLKTDARL